MTDENPYRSPTADDSGSQPDARAPRRDRSRQIALFMLAGSVAAALLYTFVDELVLKTKNGAWPAVFGTAVLSIASAIITRRVVLAPLCCFAGTMAADLLAGVAIGWGYAQVSYCIPIALAFSAPALILALVLRRVYRSAEPDAVAAS